jgi:ABC-2 type transport system permease protein
MIRRAVHMEWTKLRTVRSTAWLVVAIAGLTLALGAAAAWAVGATRCPSDTGCATEDLPRLALSGVYLGQIAVVLFAVLAITSEYGTDTMRVTLAACPRRGAVLAAKGAVVLSLVVGAGVLGVLGSLAAGRVAFPGRRFVGANAVPPLSLADSPTLRAAGGTVLYLGLIALLGLGVALIVRHTAAALSTVLGLLFLPPMIAPLLTKPPWQEWVLKASPMTAGLSIQVTKRLDTLPIGPWPGLGVLSIYAGVAVVLGATLFRLRDA